MANEEQLSILKQGVEVWNRWREEDLEVDFDLRDADLSDYNLHRADLMGLNLKRAKLVGALLMEADLIGADLTGADLSKANLTAVDLSDTRLMGADLSGSDLQLANLRGAKLMGSRFLMATVGDTIFGDLDLSDVIGLEDVIHWGPSTISTNTFALSKGKIPEVFLRGCGLSDWEIETVKLYNAALSNEERNRILYTIYDIQASQAIQISPLFISYSHGDSTFVNKLEGKLNEKGIRFWRDIHDAKAGRLEKQIDRAIRQNPTVLLVLSEHSLSSDWVEHEVRTARGLEKEKGRDVLCPVTLDDSWKSSRWPKRVMEQIMEYNILDFSAWKDYSKFEGMFRKLIDGLELFYKGEAYGK